MAVPFLKFLNIKPVWLILQHTRKIWVRTVSFAFLALASVILAQILGQVLPESWGQRTGAGAVDQVLNILATSMLAVTTFSLSIAVSAFATAAGSATPRAAQLLQQDRTTQNVLATFLGAFLFSLVGIVALKAGYYSEAGRLVLFSATVLVIAFVVVALLRWISHLADFGRIEDTLERVETAATASLKKRIENPWLGGNPQQRDPPETSQTVCADRIGYVQHIDMAAVSGCADDLDVRVWIAAMPGAFVHHAAPLLHVEGKKPDEAELERLRAAFTCGDRRNFDQDPRFGLIVMSEIALRALSPAVNDPGTAIGVIGRLVRILSPWRASPEAEVDYPNVTVPSLRVTDLVEDAFRAVARDGAGFFEVQIRLQKALHALAQIHPDTFRDAARKVSREALARAEKAGLTERDLERLREVAAKV